MRHRLCTVTSSRSTTRSGGWALPWPRRGNAPPPARSSHEHHGSRGRSHPPPPQPTATPTRLRQPAHARNSASSTSIARPPQERGPAKTARRSIAPRNGFAALSRPCRAAACSAPSSCRGRRRRSQTAGCTAGVSSPGQPSPSSSPASTPWASDRAPCRHERGNRGPCPSLHQVGERRARCPFPRQGDAPRWDPVLF